MPAALMMLIRTLLTRIGASQAGRMALSKLPTVSKEALFAAARGVQQTSAAAIKATETALGEFATIVKDLGLGAATGAAANAATGGGGAAATGTGAASTAGGGVMNWIKNNKGKTAAGALILAPLLGSMLGGDDEAMPSPESMEMMLNQKEAGNLGGDLRNAMLMMRLSNLMQKSQQNVMSHDPMAAFAGSSAPVMF